MGMTATDELRRGLDERGVHWMAVEDERKTLWESNGLTWEYFNNENGNAWLGFLGACEQDVTPEQAIAATLGSCNCSNSCTSSERTETCHDKNGFDPDTGFECTVCGTMVDSYMVTPADTGHEMQFHYCPFCGKVVDE